MNNNWITYMVKSGDSLYKIAEKYNVSVEDIKDVNNLATNTIYPNQILIIPSKKRPSNSYRTKEGDTLRTVFYKLRLDKKCLNCYEPIMDVLLVPNQLIEVVGCNKCSHKEAVYSGENLEEFLMNNEVNAVDLLNMNKNNWLTPGTKVRIL